jgi:hypothetical protein
MLDDAENLERNLVRAVELLAAAFDAKSIRYALVGGLATSIRARPRFTQDADFVLTVPQVTLPGLLEELTKAGFEFDMSTVIRQYVQEHMTVLRYGAVRVDWLKPVLPLYARAIADATPLTWTEGYSVLVATAESLILTKLVAFRPQDQMDIESLLSANRDSIDLEAIRSQWTAVADAADARIAWLENAIERLVTSRH